MPYLLVFVAFTTSAILTWRISRPGSHLSPVDLPNHRSLHELPIPRGGGIAIFAAVYLCLALAYVTQTAHIDHEVGWLAAGGLLVGAVSYLDDLRGLPARLRLVVHVAAALALVGAGFCPTDDFGLHEGWKFLPAATGTLCLVSTVWLINLYNFMDGMDGFAGGMAVFGFSFLAYFGWLRGAESYVLIALLLAATNLGFLLFNFPPARIFMGDVGSAPLGFMVAGLSLWGTRDRIFPFWVPILIFSPFLVDATVTLIQRIFRGERIWEAHCCHYYQRLVKSGWGHKKTVQAEYALMLAAGLSAILLQYLGRGTLVAAGLAGWAAAYIVMVLATHKLDRKL